MAIVDRVADTRSRFRDIVSTFPKLPLWSRRQSEPKSLSASQGISLAKLLADYDLLETVVEEGISPFLIVAPKQLAEGRNTDTLTPNMAEIGTSAPSPFTSQFRKEYNRDLMGLEGLKRYDQMRRSDGTVRSTLRLVKTPVLAARWFIEPYREEDQEEVKKVDQTAADFVCSALFDEMSISWSQVLIEALLMCDFGYYMFEKVWENRVVDGKIRTVLKKLAPRHPMDVIEWKYDSSGGPAGVVMAGETGYPQDDYYIPIDKLLIFSFDKECGNIEGISVLRSAYKHWFYKEQLYKIDAIQKERHGIGVPVIKLPPGYSQADVNTAQQLGRNLRTNERAHVVLPPLWELAFAKLEGHVVDAIKSIEHHNKEIEKNILGAFIEGGAKDEDQIMFLKATRFIADIVCEVFNCYVVPQLIDFNFSRAKYPKLRARRIGEQADWRTLSFAIRNLIGAGVLVPDDRLERYLRGEMDLPFADTKTARTVAKPQGAPVGAQGVSAAAQAAPGTAPASPEVSPPAAGAPRQPAPSAQPPRSTGGRDASGGK
jgi:hypothetical protein